MDDFKSISAEVSGIFSHYKTQHWFLNCSQADSYSATFSIILKTIFKFVIFHLNYQNFSLVLESASSL